MKQYEEKLKHYIAANKIQAEHLVFGGLCHSVEEAAEATGAAPEDIVKSICMIDDEGHLIVAIVRGNDRVSRSRVGKVLNINTPRIASQDEVLAKTGFPCGGVPSFGYKATFVIDPTVMEKEVVYTGGGSPHSLLRVSTRELVKANHGMIARVRK